MTVQVYGESYTINTVEDLNRVQNTITSGFIKEHENESAVVDRYFEDTPHLEIYDRISNYSGLLDEIVDREVEHRTDYQTLDEAADALESMQSALDEIYGIAREWV